MRESVLDPPHIHHVIESKIEDINWKGIGSVKTLKGSPVPNAVIYVRSCFSYSFVLSNLIFKAY